MSKIDELKKLELGFKGEFSKVIKKTKLTVLSLAVVAITASSYYVSADKQVIEQPSQAVEIVATQSEYYPTEAEEHKMLQIQNYLYDLDITDTNGKTLEELMVIYEVQLLNGNPELIFTDYIPYKEVEQIAAIKPEDTSTDEVISEATSKTELSSDDKYAQKMEILNNTSDEEEYNVLRQQMFHGYDITITDVGEREEAYQQKLAFIKNKKSQERIQARDKFHTSIDRIVEDIESITEMTEEDEITLLGLLTVKV